MRPLYDIPTESSDLIDSQPTHCSSHTLFECDRAHPNRELLERYIQGVFEEKHAASVQSFMPTLLALQGRAGDVCGIAGYRFATAEALFLEQYLDCPIEQAIAVASGYHIIRAEIVEVGNLASRRCKAAVQLVALLPKYLVERGARWVVFTATAGVRQVLERFHAPVYELAPARIERLRGSATEWGRYYQTDPRVMAGYLPAGLALPRFMKLSRS